MTLNGYLSPIYKYFKRNNFFELNNRYDFSKIIALYCAVGSSAENDVEINTQIYSNLVTIQVLGYNICRSILYDDVSLKEFVLEYGKSRMKQSMFIVLMQLR